MVNTVKIEEPEWIHHRTCSNDDLFARFHGVNGTSKHLLTIYSIAIGLGAKTIVDLGMGQTTGALRAAAAVTGGVVYTCDFDRRRFEYLSPQQDKHWKLYLEPSSSFLTKVPEPIDFVMHDGAHDYVNVKRDLEAIIPKMRRFGIICIHDTQQVDLYKDMLAAIRDATEKFSVSITNLPFNAGLAIVRVEESQHPDIVPASGSLPDGRIETMPVGFPTVAASNEIQVSTVAGAFRALKHRLGHLLRQGGLRS